MRWHLVISGDSRTGRVDTTPDLEVLELDALGLNEGLWTKGEDLLGLTEFRRVKYSGAQGHWRGA